MTTIHQVQSTNAIDLLAMSGEIPPGCNPDFDDGTEELVRQLAELRLTFNHN